jgi:hypothetical protein
VGQLLLAEREQLRLVAELQLERLRVLERVEQPPQEEQRLLRESPQLLFRWPRLLQLLLH